MGEIVKYSNGAEIRPTDSSVIDASEAMLEDVRKSIVPENTSMCIPIAKLSTLGAAISSMIPALNTITQSTTISADGLYRIVNLGAGDVLKASKDGSFFWGAMKTEAGKSKMAKLAEAGPIDSTTELVKGIDPAMLMMAAALYSIEQELGRIETLEKEIISFLEIDKDSEIEADVVSLNDIAKNFKHSWDNERFVASNHKMVCDIHRTARKNLIFFQKSVAEILREQKPLIAEVKVNSKLQDLYKKFKYYRLSLYTLAMSAFLEIMLSGNYKEECISAAIEEVDRYSNEYRDLFTECSSFLEGMMNKSIEANVMKGIGTASDALGKLIGSIPKIKEGQMDEFLQEKGEKIKKNVEDVSHELIGKFADVSNPYTRIFIEKMRDMLSINQTTEICCDKENIYLIAG